MENLQHSFPEKSMQELHKIKRAFYQNFTDVFIETMRIGSITKQQAPLYVKIKNKELLDAYYKEGKSVVMITGHIGNWEWGAAIGMSLQTDFHVIAAAKPMTNKGFGDFLVKMRSKTGTEVVNFKYTYKAVLSSKKQPVITYLIGDQSPMADEIEFWTPFLNQETPVFLGGEKIAKALKHPVVYLDIQRESRGVYVAEVISVCDDPANSPTFEITRRHVDLLEQSILKHPDNWLWSHKRWKHKK